MATIPSLNEANLEAICDVLAATDGGLTGSQIDRFLKACNITDIQPGITKRHRLFEALSVRQRQDGCANNIFAFIKRVMDPVLYNQNPEYFAGLRSRLNRPMAFAGFQVREDGEILPVTPAKTIDDADQRAGRLQSELRRRQVHPDILIYCRSEIIHENYFHAVLEATKSLAEKIRRKSGLTSDGAELATQAFSLGQSGIPVMAFNSLQTDTARSEQTGLMNLFIGLFGAFRNVTAHGPKILWDIGEKDALDLLTLVSLLHRRLDDAVLTRQAQQ